MIKKQGLDKESFKNYRPVSNLTFVSKILEKVILKQLEEHLVNNELMDVLQSAYRAKHSTETALLKVQSDILSSLDEEGSVVVLVLLDLSAAFDTIDHTFLLSRLRDMYDQALAWIRSYLTDRIQRVNIKGTLSDKQELNFGVPQGSVLGPILYCLYTKPVSDIIHRFGLLHHSYADDTQLYITIKKQDCFADKLSDIEQCVSEIKVWMSHNMLKLNDDKTEFIVFKSKHNVNTFAEQNVQVGGTRVGISSKIKNLGVTFDQTLSMQAHVNTIAKNCFYYLRNIARIRRMLSEEDCKAIVHTFVISRLDYCNVLLYGLPKKTLHTLQRVQNYAARLILRFGRSEHITPVLYYLHWLPVELRVDYKMLLYTYKAFYDHAPPYICDMITKYKPRRQLRSSDKCMLVVPKIRTKGYGARSFLYASATLLNELCDDRLTEANSVLLSFKGRLETLFNNLYLLK